MKRSQNFVNGKPILYLISTPIGNLKEFSPRAIEILKESTCCGCEDTRNTKSLFEKFGINIPLISCHEHNENEASEEILKHLLNGEQVCYVSDAGYPGISDPGERLVAKALDNDINVSVVNGSSAFLTALVASGLETEHFYFYGFLPSKESQRENELQTLLPRQETLIFYEAPHRIMKTLESMDKIFGNRKICIARELTKKFEEYIRGTLDEVITLEEETLKGEMVLIVEGNNNEDSIHVSDEDIMKYVKSLTEVGISTKDAIKNASMTLKINKNYIYKLIHNN